MDQRKGADGCQGDGDGCDKPGIHDDTVPFGGVGGYGTRHGPEGNIAGCIGQVEKNEGGIRPYDLAEWGKVRCAETHDGNRCEQYGSENQPGTELSPSRSGPIDQDSHERIVYAVPNLGDKQQGACYRGEYA